MDKIVTKARMMILMSKYIKSTSKHMKDMHEAVIAFAASWDNNITKIDIGEETFMMNEAVSFVDIHELTERALKETGCNGVIYTDGNKIYVKLYGKPTKSFKMLQRLIYKYSGVTIEWDTIRNDTINEPQSVEYLCYDEDKCGEAIDFIRKNRTAKDKMSIDIITDKDEGYIDISMILRVETPRGKLKSEATFSA